MLKMSRRLENAGAMPGNRQRRSLSRKSTGLLRRDSDNRHVTYIVPLCEKPWAASPSHARPKQSNSQPDEPDRAHDHASDSDGQIDQEGDMKKRSYKYELI